MKDCDARLFDVSDVLERRRESGQLYLEFLSASTMSAGVYALSANACDPQRHIPRTKYYLVLSGRGQIVCRRREDF